MALLYNLTNSGHVCDLEDCFHLSICAAVFFVENRIPSPDFYAVYACFESECGMWIVCFRFFFLFRAVMNALYVGFEVLGFYFLKIWHTCFGGSFKIQSFFLQCIVFPQQFQ